MNYSDLKACMSGYRLSDIVACEAHSIDEGCWFIYLRMRSGFELRLATSSEEETRRDCADILRWRNDPRTIPPPIPADHAALHKEIAWLTGLLALVWAAWHGFTHYWLVNGWVYTSHFCGGFFLAIIVFRLYVGHTGSAPFEWSFYVGGLPLIILLTVAITSAGKTINAEWGHREKIHIRGPILRDDDDSQTLYLPKEQKSAHVSQSELTVLDDATQQRYVIDVPGWVLARDGVRVGLIWEDEFYRGSLGWLYRKGGSWEAAEFIPKVSSR